MLIDNALARPFSRWDLDLGEGEPAHGYFARLVANEGHNSVRIYANEIGLNGRNIDPEEMLIALKRLPLPRERVAKLEMWTPVRKGQDYAIGAERLRPKQLSWPRRRWCPSCLAEAPHHRIWWDIVGYEVCPRHIMRLKGKTVGNNVVRWHWPHFDLGPHGEPLTDVTDEGTDGIDPTLERLIEDRILAREADHFRDHALRDILDISGLLGRFMGVERDVFRVGFDALMEREGSLRERLRARIVETVPAERLQRGLDASLHSLLMTSMLQEKSALGSWFEIQMLQAFADVGRIGRKRFRGGEIERREFTLVEAAARLELKPKALSRFAKRLGIGHTPWKDAHSFSEHDVEALREKLSELITLPETIEITGVPAHEFRFLEKAGLVQGYHVGSFGGVRGVRYLRSDVVELVERACARVGQREGGGLSLFSYAGRIGQPQGEIMTSVVKGELVPCGLDLEAVGFRRLMFK